MEMFPTLGQWLHLERNGGLMKGTKKDSTFICSIFFFLNRSQQDMAECFFVKSRQQE